MLFPRRALAILTAVAALLSINLFAAGPAQAATSCSGTITHSQPVYIIGRSTVIGELVIYYNSSNGGTNSACLYHRGASYGVYAGTEVTIYRCSQRSGEGQGCDATISDTDFGHYAYHAGPVGVTGTANYCVAATGWIVWEHPNPDVGKVTMPVHTNTQGC
ncbi:hypothetical protein [Streptomyces aquilus]|uniref:hypothetical protein n=1 Tax=Streptomyces aquilus TaxID=2548456 RepID=UPI001AD849B3|nr:hypothetical protein [Streptomyces aquilus]